MRSCHKPSIRFRRHCTVLVLVGAAALLPLPSKSSMDDLRPAPRLEQSYQLGIDMYAPSAAIVRLDQIIKIGKTPGSALAQAAADTRKAEMDSYHDSVTLLKTMGAPESVTGPLVNAVYTLTQPLAITDNARASMPNDAGGQKIWSTLDEAEQITGQDNGQLAAWLKLARGSDALWAFHLGNIIAVIHAAIPGKTRDLPLIDGVGALYNAAPPGTPDTLTNAMRTVADESKRHKVSDDSLKALDAAASSVFATQPAEPAAS